MSALRWYIKSLYRHLFLVDISKHARVTQKLHFLMFGRHNSKPTRPQIGLRVAKALSRTINESKFFSGETPLPSPSYSVEKRRAKKIARFLGVPPLLNTITKGGGGGGFTGKKFRLVYCTAECFSNPQTNLGARRSRRHWVMSAKKGAIFLVTLACLDISTKKRCL